MPVAASPLGGPAPNPMPQLAAAVIIGAAILVGADWLGRTLLFPRQMPAGLLAALVGGPYFMWLLWRRA